MNTVDQRARRDAAERAGHADRDRRPRPGQPQLGRGDRQRRRRQVRRLPLARRPGFTPSAANRIAQPTGTSYTDTGLAAGTYYYRVTAEDAAGNLGPPATKRAARRPPTRRRRPCRAAWRPRRAGNSVTSTWSAATDARRRRALQRLPLDDVRLHAQRREPDRPAAPARATRTAASPPAPTTTRSPRRTPPATSRPASNEVNATVPAGSAAGLVAAYRLRRRAAAPPPPTQSGNGNTGTLANATWATRPGKFGTALSFNGTNASVTVADSTSLDLTNGMTLEAWVKPDDPRQRLPDAVFKEQPGKLGLRASTPTSPATRRRRSARCTSNGFNGRVGLDRARRPAAGRTWPPPTTARPCACT